MFENYQRMKRSEIGEHFGNRRFELLDIDDVIDQLEE